MLGSTQTGHVMTLANSIIGVAILSMPFCFQKVRSIRIQYETNPKQIHSHHFAVRHHPVDRSAGHHQCGHSRLLPLPRQVVDSVPSSHHGTDGVARVWRLRQTDGRTVHDWLPDGHMCGVFRRCRRSGAANRVENVRNGAHGNHARLDHVVGDVGVRYAAGFVAQRGQFVGGVHRIGRVLYVPGAEGDDRGERANFWWRMAGWRASVEVVGRAAVFADIQPVAVVSDVSDWVENGRIVVGGLISCHRNREEHHIWNG